MIRKIILENYMSHARTELELEGGLTLLVGPNNCGKSAVLSALQTLARNRDGDFMVRHGNGEASVTVEIDDGPEDQHTLIWRRNKKGVTYNIDGREVGRLKGKIPDDLHEHLKLAEVEPAAGGDPFDVHFAEQKFPIFLLGEPESRAATFFSASSDAGRLLEIQDRHREKVREQRGKRRMLASDVARIDAELARLADVEPIIPLLESVELEHRALCEQVETLRSLEGAIAGIEAAQRRVTLERERLRACENLQSPPSQEEIASLLSQIGSMTQELARGIYARSIGQTLKLLAAAPELADPAPLGNAISGIANAAAVALQQSARAKAVGALHDAPAMEEIDDLRKSVSRIAESASIRERYRASLVALEKLGDPPELLELAALESLGQQFARDSMRLNSERALLTDCQRRIREVEGEIIVWARENPNCPVCGGVVSPAQLIEAGGHRHG